MANICCSIEMEPKTLREGQLSKARVVAADVVQKMEPKKAYAIFIEGLRPRDRRKGMDQWEQNGHNQQYNKLVEAEAKAQVVVEVPCQCSCIDSNAESPDEMKLKEPLSAPF